MSSGTLGGPGPARSAERAPEPRTRRLFFALWPDAAMREQLSRAVHRAVRGCGGRSVPLDQWHLTLAFLGAVPAVRVTELIEIGPAAVRGAGPAQTALELSLGQLPEWPRPQVLCALPIAPPAALERLARGLSAAFSAAGFVRDVKPFRAHVTVARKVARPTALRRMRVVRWRFEHFALLESRTFSSGAVYSVVETYSLYSGAPAQK